MSRRLATTVRLLRTAALALLLSGGAGAQAIAQDDLLPVDEAFALSAEAPSRDAVAVRFAIAEGYYLYRHRTSVEVVGGGFAAGALVLPPGKKHTDEFFGEVETYRDALEATLPGVAEPTATTLRLRVKYQGCADLGICYPPQTRELSVSLPAPGAGDAASAGVDGAGLPPASSLLSGGRRSGLLADAAGPGLTATGAAGLPLPDTEAYRVEAVTDGPDRIVVRFSIAPGYYLYRDKTTFAAQSDKGALVRPGEWPPARTHRDEWFGEQAVYFDEALVPLEVIRTQGGADTLTLTIGFMGCQENGVCYPPLKRVLTVDLADAPATADGVDGAASGPVDGANRPGAGLGLFAALGLALLGGLILNLMPCVLPILSLKALGLAGSAESETKARSHALWYTAGVVLSFAALGGLALALREAGLALGWGFQLQQPAVVGGLALLMFAVGLSLSGVFNLGGGLANVGGTLTQKSGPAGDFFTGVLAVVVAAPCTAPFMGAALAYAFAASPAVAIGVFVALGVGLALPFLAIGFVPGLAKRLPKPGAWMDTLKQVLAFPMYLTAVWLVWVLAKQRGADAVGWVLGGAVLLAFGLWAWETTRFRSAALRAVALAVAALGVATLWPVQQLPSAREIAAANASGTGASDAGASNADPGAAAQPAADGSVPYSAEALAALRAEGRVVFINMTADWCVSCKANERAVLSTEAFAAARERANAVYMKGDWTDVDPAITAYLQQYGAVGVPFYAVYPADGGAPQILPLLLTRGIVESALAKAANGGAG